MTFKSYSELKSLDTFEERYNYLRLKAGVGIDTFGHERYLNQRFYTSREWRAVRNEVITRDRGCDLGISGREIFGRVVVHHMNPMTPEEVVIGKPHILDPEYLISVAHITHNAIHYGSFDTAKRPMEELLVERKSGDTIPWRSYE